MEGHNSWVANRPGSLLLIPVGDVAQHAIANLCFFAQNGYCIYDDVNRRPIPGLEPFADIVDVANPLPLTFLDQYSLTECTAELATSRLRRHVDAAGDGHGRLDVQRHRPPDHAGRQRRSRGARPGLPLRYATSAGRCPIQPASRASSRAIARRTTRPCARRSTTSASASSAPAARSTPGRRVPGRTAPRVRGSAQVHDEHFRECVALQAQYCFDTFGKFPATVPTCSSPCTCRATIWTWSTTTRCSSPAPTSARHAEHLRALARDHGVRGRRCRSRFPGIRIGHWQDQALTGCTVLLPAAGAMRAGVMSAAARPARARPICWRRPPRSGDPRPAADGRQRLRSGRGGRRDALPARAGHRLRYRRGPRADRAGGGDLRPRSRLGRRPTPTRAAGYAACLAASADEAREGNVGAGCGACGRASCWGRHAARRAAWAWRASEPADAATMGALAVVNAGGDVLERDGTIIAGTRGPDGFAGSAALLRRGVAGRACPARR